MTRSAKSFIEIQYYVYQTDTTGCTPEQIKAIKEMDAKDNATEHKETRHLDENFDIDDDHNKVALELALSHRKDFPEDLNWKYWKSQIPEAVTTLSIEDRVLITEIFYEGKTATEIAQRDGISISTVTRHTKKVIQMLQKYYSEFGKK